MTYEFLIKYDKEVLKVNATFCYLFSLPPASFSWHLSQNYHMHSYDTSRCLYYVGVRKAGFDCT